MSSARHTEANKQPNASASVIEYKSHRADTDHVVKAPPSSNWSNKISGPAKKNTTARLQLAQWLVVSLAVNQYRDIVAVLCDYYSRRIIDDNLYRQR